MSIQAKFLHLQAIHNLLAPYRYLYCVDLEATCDEVDESESLRCFENKGHIIEASMTLET